MFVYSVYKMATNKSLASTGNDQRKCNIKDPLQQEKIPRSAVFLAQTIIPVSGGC